MSVKKVVSAAESFAKMELAVGQSALAIVSDGETAGIAVASWRNVNDPLTVKAISLPTGVTARASGNAFVIDTRYATLISFQLLGG